MPQVEFKVFHLSAPKIIFNIWVFASIGQLTAYFLARFFSAILCLTSEKSYLPRMSSYMEADGSKVTSVVLHSHYFPHLSISQRNILVFFFFMFRFWRKLALFGYCLIKDVGSCATFLWWNMLIFLYAWIITASTRRMLLYLIRLKKKKQCLPLKRIPFCTEAVIENDFTSVLIWTAIWIFTLFFNTLVIYFAFRCLEQSLMMIR